MHILIHLAGDTAGSEGSFATWANAAPAAYEPNAALVNYYGGEGDTLCGHQVCVVTTASPILSTECHTGPAWIWLRIWALQAPHRSPSMM